MARTRAECIIALSTIAADGIELQQRVGKKFIDRQSARGINGLFEQAASIINELEALEKKGEI